MFSLSLVPGHLFMLYIFSFLVWFPVLHVYIFSFSFRFLFYIFLVCFPVLHEYLYFFIKFYYISFVRPQPSSNSPPRPAIYIISLLLIIYTYNIYPTLPSMIFLWSTPQTGPGSVPQHQQQHSRTPCYGRRPIGVKVSRPMLHDYVLQHRQLQD